MSLPEFKNEAEFRTEWVAPFLSKLGYILPKHVHGTGEQGKDFFFAEHDKFGHLKFSAVQVKLGRIGAGHAQLNDLLDQVKRSFTVTLKHHKGADRQRISSVYIMTNKSISDGAREYISDYCRQEHYGENVFFLDGETLDNLDKRATFMDDESLRNRLISLSLEADFNIKATTKLWETSTNGNPALRACRTLAVEEALRNPLPEEVISYEKISEIWSYLNAINGRFYLNKDIKELEHETLAKIAGNARDRVRELKSIASRVINEIDLRYNLELEVEG